MAAVGRAHRPIGRSAPVLRRSAKGRIARLRAFRAGLLARTEDEHRQLRERGESVLEEIERLASDLDRPLTTTLTEGRPTVRISEHAAERDADLVVGRQGMTGVGKRVLGGVTEQTIARGEIPVLVVQRS